MADDLSKLPGLRERQLVALGPCVVCGQPQLCADITFYKIRIERAGFQRSAIERRVGLQMVLGNSALAQAMGPDEDIAKVFDGPHEVFVHEHCAHNIHSVLLLTPKKDEAAGAV